MNVNLARQFCLNAERALGRLRRYIDHSGVPDREKVETELAAIRGSLDAFEQMLLGGDSQ
jgi:hypothetical protein